MCSSDLRVVDGEARVTEVARMLGGDPESDASRAHARELLESAAHALREAPKKRARGKRAADDSRGE